MVHGRVVQYHDSQRHALFALGNPVDQVNHLGASDGVRVQVVPELSGGKLQGANHINAVLTGTGIGGMGLAFGRPGSLHIGDAGKATFVQIEQTDLLRLSGAPQTFQVVLCGLKLLGIAFFFSDRRVRVNDKPRFLRCRANESRLKTGASG